MKEQKKRTRFWVILGINILAVVITGVLKIPAAGAFILSSVFWWEKEHALEDKKNLFKRNPTKQWYAYRGKLDKYRKHMTFSYYFWIVFGMISVLLEIF